MKNKSAFILLLIAVLMTACTLNAAQKENGKIYDRNGEELSAEVFPLLTEAEESFTEYLNQNSNVMLTIDAALQEKAQKLLDDKGLGGGAVVLVDINTGEPLVIASSGEGENHAVMSAYTPYQLFMPCTATAAMEEGIVNYDDFIECEGVFNRYVSEGYAPECWINKYGYTHPEENVATALRDSCEHYFYCCGNDLGIDAIRKFARAYGLGESSGIELLESIGIMAGRSMEKSDGCEWCIGDTLEAAVGKSESRFTPLQLAEYCAAVANKGTRYSASILHSVSDENDKKIYCREPQVLSMVKGLYNNESKLEETEWDAIHKGLYDVQNAEYENGLGIAGKSGGATEGICDRIYMGFMPYDDPKYAIVVVAEQTDNMGLPLEIAIELMQECIKK